MMRNSKNMQSENKKTVFLSKCHNTNSNGRNGTKSRIISMLMTAPLTLQLLAFPLMAPVSAAGVYAAETKAAAVSAQSVMIGTVDEFITFASNCTYDKWSMNRNVYLTGDIDLSGKNFDSVPIFCGSFDGQNHTVSGIKMSENVSSTGLFRYIQKGAEVKNLNVKADIKPGSSAEKAGGIAGVNSGTIENCSFDGAVTAGKNAGGIAGQNTSTGKIAYCKAYGEITGKKYTGGITGSSTGLVIKCENYSAVNITLQVQTTSEKLEENSAAEDTDDVAEAAQILNTGSEDAVYDTGGIAGFSQGSIQSCTNSGNIGYEHVGYNTGGIAGRQTGYIGGCSNTGLINGRKDIGGICGQAEPDIIKNLTKDNLSDIRDGFNALSDLIDAFIDDADSSYDSISGMMGNAADYATDAGNSANDMINELGSFTDTNIDTVNELISRITGICDDMTEVMDAFENASDEISSASTSLESALKNMDSAGGSMSEAISSMRNAMSNLDSANSTVKTVAGKIQTQASQLQQDIIDRNYQAALEDLSKINGYLGELSAAQTQASNCIDNMSDALDSFDDANDEIRRAVRKLENVSADLSDAADAAADAFGKLSDILDDIASDDKLEFSELGDGFYDASDSVHESLNQLSDEFDRIKDSGDASSDLLSGDLKKINNKFNDIVNLIVDSAEELKDTSETDLIKDTSDENVGKTADGKIYSCKSNGAVNGDRNAGGIAGAMGLEITEDPEDDLADKTAGSALTERYETRAVVESCKNYGAVTAKNDCGGGIAGRMYLGTVIYGENYGDIINEDADYMGGIAGRCASVIRSSYSKCTVSADKYAGGIAGSSAAIKDCYAIVDIQESGQKAGAIAGYYEEDGNTDILDRLQVVLLSDVDISGNYFVDKGTGGVDGISYEGIAEPVDFDTMRSIAGLPKEFTAFSLMFRADGNVVSQVSFAYGEDLSFTPRPEIPQKDGYYGVWPYFDDSCVTSDVTLDAEYIKWTETVSSEEQDENGLVYALADGRYTDDTKLTVSAQNYILDDEEQIKNMAQKIKNKDSEQIAETSSDEEAVNTDNQNALTAVLENTGEAVNLPAGEYGILYQTNMTDESSEEINTTDIRLLTADKNKDAEVWKYDEGSWKKIRSDKNGQYMIVETDSADGVYYVVPGGFEKWKIAAAAGGPLLLILGIILIIRKRRRKKIKE